MAPLTDEGVQQAELASKNEILKGSDLIVLSPYTRALQTASIISKVEIDLHEFIPDKTFCIKEVMNQNYYTKTLWIVMEYIQKAKTVSGKQLRKLLNELFQYWTSIQVTKK